MPVIVLDLISEVLSILGTYAPGESIAPADSQSVLFTLGGIVDGYGAEALTRYERSAPTFTATPGKQSYTLGPDPGNDWVTPVLPAQLESWAPVTGSGTNALEWGPREILTAAQWQALALKQMPNTMLSACWPQYGATAHTLSFWPAPQISMPVILYLLNPIPRFTSITNVIVMRPGYQELFTYELAIKSSGKFGTLPDWVPVAWREAKSRVKESNFQVLDSVLDPGLAAIGRRGPSGADLLAFYTGK